MYFKRLQEDSCLGVLIMERPAFSLHGDSWEPRSSSTSHFLGPWKCRNTASFSPLFFLCLSSLPFFSLFFFSPIFSFYSLSFSLPKGFFWEQRQRRDPAIKVTRTRTRLQQRWNLPLTVTSAAHKSPQGPCSAPRLCWPPGQKESNHLSLRQGTRHQGLFLSPPSSLPMARHWFMVWILIVTIF